MTATPPAEESAGELTASHPAGLEPEMPPAYEPAGVEERLYAWWEARGFFAPAGPREPGGGSFTIVMPPPNVTGELHLGHALTASIEDALIRWHRMRGDDTLWLPGVDHAAIAVQNVVEREIGRERLTRHDLGREHFLERTWEWVERTRARITSQHRRLGASADWSRERFTMDPGPALAVRTTFFNLYRDGLIYRGERLINWCPDCQTALSDLEVEHAEEPGKFWHVRYELLDAAGRPDGAFITIATTRPETIPADTAIAVNPQDERYRHLIGRQVRVPIVHRPIPVIGDEAVSIESGSGALKVTPGHDPVDFEIGERHQLPIINLMAVDGTLTEEAGPYAHLDRFEARRRIVADIEEAGQLVREEPYAHAIGHCQRSGTIVEPLISKQWFMRVRPEHEGQYDLAGEAIRAVEDGRITFVPPRFERTYMHWMENIRDWCISRQIWWGHRIPVWYCDACAEVTVAIEDPTACTHCGSAAIHQDEDTLDTWFSSGLWPHSTLGWPEPGAPDLARFYPTQVMETGYDIIFFWVARMIMLSLYNMQGVAPFETVYLHGLVRAPDGSKMSKSKGNVVDPLQSIDRYGTDALRYALTSSTSPGNDQRITDQRLEAGRNFANKLWNASRFVITLAEPGDDLAPPRPGAATAVEDRWMLSRTERLVATVDDLLRKFELGEAVRQLRDFFWEEFADWYIELAKVRIRAGDRTPLPVLVHVLDRVLRMLHPFMPFVTEAIWGRLELLRHRSATEDALIVARYPEAAPGFEDSAAEAQLRAVQEIVVAIRNIRAEKRVDAGRWIEAHVAPGGGDEALAAVLAQLTPAIEMLARVRPLHIAGSADALPAAGAAVAVVDSAQIAVPLAGLLDVAAEQARLSKQIDETRGEIDRLERQLANEQFVGRAPAELVTRERERLATARGRLASLEQTRTDIGSGAAE